MKMHHQTNQLTPTVLIVDDAFERLSMMQGLFKSLYRVKVAPSGQRALEIVSSGIAIDLILLDNEMPVIDGYEVIRLLKAKPLTSNIPVILVSEKGGLDDERLGYELGAVDCVSKSISTSILTARVKRHIESKVATDILRSQNDFLQAEVARRTQEVMDIQDVTIMAMASLAEMRDFETANHLLRTQIYVKALAQRLALKGRFLEVLTPENIELLYKAAPLHDIGKVGIPDRILLKPGKLTVDEFEVMKTHTTLGRDALANAEAKLNLHLPFFAFAREIAYSHQERWDGSGYPQGLVGEDIPVPARLMALADVYDAVVSSRVYKSAMTHEQAIEIIESSKGKHFDPVVVEAFMEIHFEFHAIALAYEDKDVDLASKQIMHEQAFL